MTQRTDIYFLRSVQTDAGGNEPRIQLEMGRFLFRFYVPTMNLRISGDLPPLQHNLRDSVLVQQEERDRFRDNSYLSCDRYQ